MQHPWRPEEIRSKDLALTLEGMTREELRLRLEGTVSLRHEKAKFPYAYEARLAGHLVYNRTKAEFTRFDVAAVGDWSWQYERKGGPKDILGVALELHPHPFASPGYDREFPGYNMGNYGYRQDRE